MKILDLNNMLDAASDSEMPALEHHVAALEASVNLFAIALANHLGIFVDSAAYEHGFGGLCAEFHPMHDGQPCPDVIAAGDPGGDWESSRGHSTP